MDSQTSRAATNPPPDGGAHANGNALLAVAEGNADAQPDEATLAHIFSCERCSQNVRDIRSGLAALGIKPGAPRKVAAPAALPVATALPMEASDAALLTTPETDDVSDRSRKLIWKVVVVGAVLGGALFYLRSFATSLH